MVKRIDSDALGDVKRALGLTGAGSPVTELMDGVVDQTLSVNELARRGRTLGQGTGIFYAIMQNVHGAAETLTTSVNVYDVGTTIAVPPYPSTIPAGFDVWLLYAASRRQSGTGTYTGSLSIQLPTTSRGWGVDDSGVQINQNDPMAIVYWDTLILVQELFATKQGAIGPWMRIGLRIPRGVAAATGTLRFSSVSSGVQTVNCSLILGVFPASLGQDGLV